MSNPGDRRLACTVGADLGTTNAKAIAFDDVGREIARAEEPVPLLHHAGGGAEQDPRAVYAAANAVLAQTAQAAWRLGYAVERVGLSAAMHSIIPVAADGTPLTNAMTWMDTRASAEAQALWATPKGKSIYAATGTPVAAMSPLVKLLWIRRNQPKIFETAYKFVSLKEWVWYRWFGEWAVDASITSATGMYSLRARDWDAEALALVGIGPERLSRIVPTTYTRGGLRVPQLHAAGIDPAVRINVGASDGVLANLGVGAIDEQTMVLTIGTSLAARSGSRQPVTDPATELFCYVLDTERFIAGGASNSGGIVLDWLYHKVLGPGWASQPLSDDGFTRMIAAAEHARAGNLLCLPYVAGERAPLWQADARAVFFGLDLEDTAATIARSAVEGIILNAYWIASGLIERLGAPRQVLATGRVLETEWIRQLTADVFGIPVQYRGAVDASVLGAATLANISTGLWTWERVLGEQERQAEEHAYTSQPRAAAHEAYARQFGRFRALARVLTTELAGLYLGA
ncbi:MAG TPA: gluconokinase [Ktedonobacterales bacterium]